MNWFKRLFQNNDTKLQEGDYVFTGDENLPKDNIEKEGVDIGEPVLSFIECVRYNRRRFYFKTHGVFLRSHTITLTDKQTGEQWCARQYYGYDSDIRLEDKLDWLTEDEKGHLVKELSKIAKDRAEQLRAAKAIRKNRQMSKERDRLKGVYCK